MNQRPILSLALAFVLPLAACQEGASEEPAPPESPAAMEAAVVAPAGPFAAQDRLKFTGTEPFWGGEVAGTALTLTRPDSPDGTVFTVERAASEQEIVFSGTDDHPDLDVSVRAMECSDGMSDRSYPFTVTFNTGTETLKGCGWSDAHPYSGPENP